MSNYIYPAVFTLEEDGLYSVNFPDFEACFTQGSDLQDALEMAKDVLSVTLCDMEDDKIPVPTASSPLDISHDSSSFVSPVSVNTLEYRKTYSGKAVKKTLTIPSWLNDAAISKNVNFSQLLQQALVDKLNIH